MKIELDKRFRKKLEGRFGKYRLEVGVLQDAPHLLPRRGERGQKGQDVLGSYAGGPIRRSSRKNSGVMVSQVSKENRERMGLNFYSEPFQKSSSDIIRFTQTFFKLCFGRSEPKRLENLLQAIVRNPILRGDYGGNSSLTTRIKGFNRGMIDTAQLFKSIKAKVMRGR